MDLEIVMVEWCKHVPQDFTVNWSLVVLWKILGLKVVFELKSEKTDAQKKTQYDGADDEDPGVAGN